MTVAELIVELQKMPQDWDVITYDSEWGCEEVSYVGSEHPAREVLVG